MTQIVNERAILGELYYRSLIASCHLDSALSFALRAIALLSAGRAYCECRALRVANHQIAFDLRRSPALLKQAAAAADDFGGTFTQDEFEHVVIFAITEGLLEMKDVNRGANSDVALVRLVEPDGPVAEALSLWLGRCRAGFTSSVAAIRFRLAPWFAVRITLDNSEELARDLSAAFWRGHLEPKDAKCLIIPLAGRLVTPKMTRKLALSAIKYAMRTRKSSSEHAAGGRPWQKLREALSRQPLSEAAKMLSAV